MIARSTPARAWATATDSAPGQLSLLNLGPFSLESPGPEFLSPAVAGAVSAGRSDATRKAYSGSSVSSWPRPAIPASSGCRLHRWTSPNTSRPWWGSRSFHGAADGARPVPRVTSGGQKTGCPNRGLHVWTTGEAGGPVPRKAVRSRGPQVWSESGVFRLVRDLVGGALPAVAHADSAEHGPGAITDLYGRSCHRIRQEGFF